MGTVTLSRFTFAACARLETDVEASMTSGYRISMFAAMSTAINIVHVCVSCISSSSFIGYFCDLGHIHHPGKGGKHEAHA